MSRFLAGCLMFSFALASFGGFSYAQDGPKVKLEEVKCPLMPKRDVKEDKSADFLDAKVYFCCGNCVKKFSADPEKFAVKANHQLALTKQFTQKACPISGSKIDEDQTLEMGGLKVGFCCGNCKKKVVDAKDDDAKTELVFGVDAFKKAFEKKKVEEDGDGV